MIDAYDNIIFDFDGTLADTCEDVWLSVEYAAEAAGGKLPADFRRCPPNLSLPLAEILAAVKPENGEKDLSVFCEALDRHYRKLNTFENTRLYPGIQGLLEAIRDAGKDMYIVTMKSFEPTGKILTQKGWDSYFRAWLSPDGPGDWKKNKTELIQYLIDGGLSAERSVYIGDSWGDAAAARANGVTVIGLLYGDGDNTLLRNAKPDYLAANPEELAALLFPQARI